MKSFFKFLSKNKLYTFIEVFGLSIALAFVILICNYVKNEFTMDEFQKKGDNILKKKREMECWQWNLGI